MGGYGATSVSNNWYCRLPADIPDGTSNTIALGETLPAQNTAWGQWRCLTSYHHPATTIIPINFMNGYPIYTKYNPCTPSWGGYDGSGNQYPNGSGLSGPVPANLQKYASIDYLYGGGFNSRHPGGCNFVLADASVHFISNNISMTVFQYLGCRNDGVAIDPTQVP
jgi:prepilin-type processing-associated H-X9-DG protein